MEWIGLSAGILLIVIVSFAAIAVFTVVIGRWMRGRFRTVSGWAELARRYPGPAVSPAPVQKTSIQVGPVYYRFGAQIGGTPQGVYLVFRG
ncbi:MAG: hypothetical protein HGA53_10445, partial [Anaerolineaceae bacterium]|nr:hypothetical protein [Anaerolineaceae bacterium]